MRLVVHFAAIQDRDGATLVLDKIRRRFPWLELIWADGGYNAWQVDAAVAKLPLLGMEIVKRSDDIKASSSCRAAWLSSAPSPGSDETDVSPRTSRTLAKPWPPSSPSPAPSWPLGDLPGRRSRIRQTNGFASHDDGGLQADGEETFAGTRGNDEMRRFQTFPASPWNGQVRGPLAAVPGARKEGRNQVRGQRPRGSPIGVFPGLERSHVPCLHETRLSGQPNRDMDDLALAPHAQWETTRLEQL